GNYTPPARNITKWQPYASWTDGSTRRSERQRYTDNFNTFFRPYEHDSRLPTGRIVHSVARAVQLGQVKACLAGSRVRGELLRAAQGRHTRYTGCWPRSALSYLARPGLATSRSEVGRVSPDHCSVADAEVPMWWPGRPGSFHPGRPGAGSGGEF